MHQNNACKALKHRNFRASWFHSICFQGKLEAEIELLTKEEALQRPAGKGRDEPNANPHLDKPKYATKRQ